MEALVSCGEPDVLKNYKKIMNTKMDIGLEVNQNKKNSAAISLLKDDSLG